MASVMKAGVYYPGEGMRLEERPVPSPEPGQLLVQVQSVGICGSDVHYYRDGHIGDWVIEKPHVLGHEFSGVVAEVGDRVNDFHMGDRVAVEPCLPCGECQACIARRYNVCQRLRFIGSPHTDGAFQQYVMTRPRFTHHLPPELDFEAGALVEPTAVAVQAARRGRLALGETVVVVGAGPIGLLILAVALASGASRVYVADVNPVRLAKAAEMGAAAVIDSREDGAKAVADLTEGRGADVVFEAVGAAATIDLGVSMARPGGRLVAVGVSPKEVVPFNFFALQSKELDILPVWLYLDAFPAAIALLASGRVRADAIVTHRFPIDEIRLAMDTATQQIGAPIKVMVNAQP